MLPMYATGTCFDWRECNDHAREQQSSLGQLSNLCLDAVTVTVWSAGASPASALRANHLMKLSGQGLRASIRISTTALARDKARVTSYRQNFA